MIDRTHPLPMVRQCRPLALSRSTAYYQPPSVSSADLALMRRIDQLHLASPFAGARMLRDLLRREGHRIGRKRVRTVMACAAYITYIPMHRGFVYLCAVMDWAVAGC
jgi:putative transposase